MSAREWRAVREGETHAATKTSTNNTPDSFIVGIGASGAVLAGAAIVFVTLVGIVSFNVWPTSNGGTGDSNVELSAATKSALPQNNASLSPTGGGSVQAASTNGATVTPTGVANAGGSNAGGQHQGGSGGGGGGADKGPASSPPTTTPVTPAPSGDLGSGNSDGSSGSGSAPPVQAGKDPSHPVHPTHPDRPHEGVSTGSKEPADGDTDVTSKGPLVKPTHDSGFSPTHDFSGSTHGSSSSSESSWAGHRSRGHRSSRSWH